MTALKSWPLNAVLCLLLLFSQAVDIGHSHDADLQSTFDCEVCLKIGSVDDVLFSDTASLSTVAAEQIFTLLEKSQTFYFPTTASARAPPSYT